MEKARQEETGKVQVSVEPKKNEKAQQGKMPGGDPGALIHGICTCRLFPNSLWQKRTVVYWSGPAHPVFLNHVTLRLTSGNHLLFA
jgi:hypothetical protein